MFHCGIVALFAVNARVFIGNGVDDDTLLGRADWQNGTCGHIRHVSARRTAANSLHKWHISLIGM